ncbi:MAG: sugar phosphate isomerase/epimerase family protein [Armatimonadota bacterium]
MRLACQLGMTPGNTIKEKIANLERWGYEGVELHGRGLADTIDEVKAAVKDSSVKVCTICAGYRGVPLDTDRAQRDLAVSDAKEILSMAGDLGAVGMIFVPIFGGPRMPDLSPLYSPIELENLLVLKIVEELAAHAEKAGTLLLLEPLQRGETHFWNRLEQAVAVAEKVGNPAVKIMADFFHMNIEEPRIDDSIRRAGCWIQHVHLADSHRAQPGTGHTDFKSGFAALKEIGFENYMALECRIEGDPDEALPACAEFLRSCM